MTAEGPSILVASDGSPHSLRILPFAKAFAQTAGLSVVVGEVVRPNAVRPQSGESRQAATARLVDAAMQQLRGALQAAGVEGRVVATLAREDDRLIGDAIVRQADEADAVMLAMDTRGYGVLHQALHGSVALDVIGRTTRPVMLNSAVLAEAPSPAAPYRILATSDGSPASEEVLRALAPLLAPERFAVSLLRVVDRDATSPSEAERQLTSLVPLFLPGLQVETKVREIARGGGIESAILEEARAAGAHAIAMSTHGITARRHLVAGGTALAVLGRSTLPVIMARGDD